MRNLREGKFHTKLILFFTLVLGIIMLTGVNRYKALNDLVNESGRIFIKSNDIIEIRKNLEDVKNSFADYITSTNKSNLEAYYDSISDLYKSQKKIDIKDDLNKDTVKLKNLKNMIDSYVELLESAIEDSKDNVNYKKTTNNYEEADKLYGYIDEYSYSIMSNQLVQNTKEYTGIRNKVIVTNELSVVILTILVLFSLTVIIAYSVKITEPIENISKKMLAIAKGNYNVIAKEDDVTGEIKELYERFNSMAKCIKANMDNLSNKRLLEQTVADEKISQLNMKNALIEAELSALQSQVDPHFMFNTINVGAQLAMMNEDDETVTYLENVADVFRYNLDGVDREVSLKKEIDNSKSYLEVIKTRFGDTIDYKIDIDEDVDTSSIMIPKMSLQPLIENAYIHGVSKNEDGGTIKLLVKKDKDDYLVTVANHGEELPQSTINRMMWQSEEQTKPVRGKGHTTRLGVSNVIRRLKLYLNKQDVIEITHKDEMNCFTLIIPKQDDEVKEA